MDTTDILIWADWCELEQGLDSTVIRAIARPVPPLGPQISVPLRRSPQNGYGYGYGDGHGNGST